MTTNYQGHTITILPVEEIFDDYDGREDKAFSWEAIIDDAYQNGGYESAEDALADAKLVIDGDNIEEYFCTKS
jgi:hypothetical protein